MPVFFPEDMAGFGSSVFPSSFVMVQTAGKSRAADAEDRPALKTDLRAVAQAASPQSYR